MSQAHRHRPQLPQLVQSGRTYRLVRWNWRISTGTCAVLTATIKGWIDGQFRNDATEFEADITALRAVGLTE